jgi:hypothetical protein
MPNIDADEMDGPSLSYSVRAKPEASARVWWNRIGVTASLFTAAMGVSFLLGRRR